MIIVHCSQCGKEKLSDRYAKRYFCNRACCGKWKSQHTKGENNPNWRGRTRVINCVYCGKTKEVRIKKEGNHFCSRECCNRWQREQGIRGKEHPNWKGGMITVHCDFCGKPKKIMYCELGLYNHHFCDKACRGYWQSKNKKAENNPMWRGGISFDLYGQDFTEELKDEIRGRDGYKCQKCGAPQAEFERKLPIHHIDYNKKNNTQENLITLCKYCNSEVNFNRLYWTEYFKKKMESICYA